MVSIDIILNFVRKKLLVKMIIPVELNKNNLFFFAENIIHGFHSLFIHTEIKQSDRISKKKIHQFSNRSENNFFFEFSDA
jgi:hypothetical protein